MRRTVDYGSSSAFVITEIVFENAIVIDDNASARFKREVYRRDKKATVAKYLRMIRPFVNLHSRSVRDKIEFYTPLFDSFRLLLLGDER